MFSIFILLFIGFNIAFTLFDIVWFIVALKAQGIGTISLIFGLASLLHTYMTVLAWEKLKSLDPKPDDEQ